MSVPPSSDKDATRWYRQGAIDEAAAREEKRRLLGDDVRQYLDAAEAYAEHQHPTNVGALISTMAYIFASKLTGPDRWRLWRALWSPRFPWRQLNDRRWRRRAAQRRAGQPTELTHTQHAVAGAIAGAAAATIILLLIGWLT